MSRNWNLIRKQGIWEEVLGELIGETKAAIKSGSAERDAVRSDLREFIDQSPNFDSTVPVDKYDDIASKLHKQLVQADLEEQLASMESRQPVFTDILKEIRDIAEQANVAAEMISLTRVRKIVDSVTEVVDSLREVRESVKASDEPKLAQALDDLLDAFDHLRAATKK